MSNIEVSAARWRVRPKAFDFELSAWIRNTAGCGTGGCLGCSSLVIAFTLLAVASYLVADLRHVDWTFRSISILCLAAAILLLLSVIVYVVRALGAERNVAHAATFEARAKYASIADQADAITRSVETAERHLATSAAEFRQHRYAPFWDAMENATKAIGQTRAAQSILTADINRYVDVLHERDHDFPDWDHAVTRIADIEPALAQFRQLKDAAESDYHFASIRQMVETRQVMIEGFKNLGDALRHLETAVVTSIADLRTAINRSLMLRAANSTHLQVIAGFLVRFGSGETTRNS
jgi:hypothetical protein